MKDDILTYREMCDTEKVQTLQRGMNYRLNPPYSVILMSQRSNAPYNDVILDDNMTIVYEGHDAPRKSSEPDLKAVDQPYYTKTGRLTQNGLFANAVKRVRKGGSPESVKVYEKLFSGVWSFKGIFHVIDYELSLLQGRHVFKFRLRLSSEITNGEQTRLRARSRIIPTEIKKEVWKRDGGKCTICGKKDELHFDHVIPYSKGGSSITADNVRILCARHNLSKSDKIE